MNKLNSFVLLSALLAGCGGGGSESMTTAPAAGDSAPVNTVPDPIQSQPAITEFSLEESKPNETGAVVESTAQNSREIAVPDGFALSSQRSFNLRVTRSEEDDQPAYLSLCTDYQHHNDGSYRINYNSCLLRTSLSDYNYETVITVTNDTPGLVAALWFMDQSKEPLITDWRF